MVRGRKGLLDLCNACRMFHPAARSRSCKNRAAPAASQSVLGGVGQILSSFGES